MFAHGVLYLLNDVAGRRGSGCDADDTGHLFNMMRNGRGSFDEMGFLAILFADVIKLLGVGAFKPADNKNGIAFTGKIVYFLLARFRNITYLPSE